MNIYRWYERHLLARQSLAMDRFRAFILRLRGAELGSKSRIGARCRVQRPWLLEGGSRVEFESDVFVKIESDNACLKLGDEVFVGKGSEFDIVCHMEVGRKVLIAPGCFITDHNHRMASGTYISDQGIEASGVKICDDVWLGAGVVVLPGVTMHTGSVAAAGAVVTKDVAEMEIVGGVPATPIGRRTDL